MAFIGTAVWSVPLISKEKFETEGTHLERYAKALTGVEINSSFYREHKHETYIKWANSVPAHFRFSVKLSRFFTHETCLKETGSLTDVLEGISGLGEKWGVLLVQLPPSLSFVKGDVEKFLKSLRQIYSGVVVWEPRHLSWTKDPALDVLADFKVSKVRADPEPCLVPALKRRKVEEVLYYRLHGTPEIYKSRYSIEVIAKISDRMNEFTKSGSPAWCIFDNTTFGFATENALELKAFCDSKSVRFVDLE